MVTTVVTGWMQRPFVTLGMLAIAMAMIPLNDALIKLMSADMPLAERCVQGGALVTGPTGRIFDDKNIGMARAMRDLGQHLRETGESKGYNAPFSARDRSAFLQTMEQLCRKAKTSGE